MLEYSNSFKGLKNHKEMVKLGEILYWVSLIVLLILFFNVVNSILQILVGISIILLLFFNPETSRKRDTIIERASNESFYDAMKWVAFGIFAIIYPALNGISFAIACLDFALILFIINYRKQTN